VRAQLFKFTTMAWQVDRVGQSRVYTPHMTVHLVISMPKIPYIYTVYVMFWPTLREDEEGTRVHAG
jgi:hypothetical protein